jgi:hypothetical protein
MLARQAAAAAGSQGGEGLARAEGRRGEWAYRAYAVPFIHPSFIRAISDTSPTSQLNVTFLQTCASEPQYARRSRGQRTAAYNCRSVGICAMLAGSVPVSRFSPNSLPGNHQCEAEATQRQTEHWTTYRLAMDGIEETKAGNRPVSAFRATFLRHHAFANAVQRHNGAHWGAHWGGRGRASPTTHW